MSTETEEREQEQKGRSLAECLCAWSSPRVAIEDLATDPRWALAWSAEALSEKTNEVTREVKGLKYAPIWLRELVAIAMVLRGLLGLAEGILPHAPHRPWLLTIFAVGVAAVTVPTQRRAALQVALAITCPQINTRIGHLWAATEEHGRGRWQRRFRAGWVLLVGTTLAYAFLAIPRSYTFIAAKVTADSLFEPGILRMNKVSVVGVRCNFDLFFDTSKLSSEGFSCDELRGGEHAAEAKLTIDLTDLTGPCDTAAPNWKTIPSSADGCVQEQEGPMKMGKDALIHLQTEAGPSVENCQERIRDARLQFQLELATRCLAKHGQLVGGRDLKLVNE